MSKYNFDKIVNRLNTDSVKWDFKKNCSEKAQEDGLPMWIADMDFECPDPIIESLLKRVNHKIFGYSLNDSNVYYNAVCGWYKRRFNWDIDRKSIVFSPGVVPAIAVLTRVLTNKGDGVIIQNPVYNPFGEKIEKNDRKIINNALIYKDGKYTMDFEDLEEKAKCKDNTLMILCSPHNPGGRVWTKEELKKVVEICKRHDVWIISDEIHSDLTRKNVVHTPLVSICDDYKHRIMTCTAPSKTFGLAGMQISNIVIDNEEIMQKYKEDLEASGIPSTPNPFAIVSTIAAYNECEDWLEELLNYLDKNIDFAKKYIETNMTKAKFIYPEGTYLIWLDLNGYGIDKYQLEDLMYKKANVIFKQGYYFGDEGSGFERINAACPKSVLEDCLNRIKSALDCI